ncbi:MAG: diaminobutyrate acetyltransferase [Hyphomonadaceae bacterium]
MDTLIPALGQGGGKERMLQTVIREPTAEDGAAISDLIARCPPLDRNSVYSTLLLCTHFAKTCALAEGERRPEGWVSAYLPPSAPDTLFVWQVAIDAERRGEGLAGRLIAAILARPACRRVKRLQTTITCDNEASWALFRNVAAKFGADFSAAPHFLRTTHFAGDHETEHLVTIEPIQPAADSGQ